MVSLVRGRQLVCALILRLFFAGGFLNGQIMQDINVLFINEDGNYIAEDAVNVALDYVMKNSKLGMKIHIDRVYGQRSANTTFLDDICTTYSRMLTAKKQPHVVLDTTMTGMASETVKAFTAALNIPTISGSFGQAYDLLYWSELKPGQEKYLIQIMPPADVIPEIVRAIVINQKITDTAILFDTSYVMDHKYSMLLQNVTTRQVIEPIAASAAAQIKRLTKLHIFTFFIIGSPSAIKPVLDAASQLNYFTRKFAWHAITDYNTDLKCNCSKATIIYVRPTKNEYQDRSESMRYNYKLNTEQEITSGFYFDLALNTFLNIRSIITKGAWPKITYITCDAYDAENPPKINSLDLRTYFKKPSTEKPVYGFLNVSANGMSMMDFSMDVSAVTIQKGLTVNSVKLGIWKSGLNNTLQLIKPKMMAERTPKVIYKIVTAVQPPYIFNDSTANNGVSGYCVDLIDEIAKIMDFEYEISIVADNKFGNLDDNGNWNGVVKELMEKRADIGVGSMWVMAEREDVIDFTIPWSMPVGHIILMKFPKTHTALLKYWNVLSLGVWLCIVALYFMTSFLLWVYDRWSPFSYQNSRKKYEDDPEKREFTLKECLWFCMTSMSPQGGGEAPKNLSGRIVVALWWYFGFIIISSYSANVASFVTTRRLFGTVHTIETLATQVDIKYAPVNGSETMKYFERRANIEAKFFNIWKDMVLNDNLSDVERANLAVWDYPLTDTYTKLWQAMKQTGLPNTLEEALARVRASPSVEHGFAFIGDATDIWYTYLTSCDVELHGYDFSRKPYAIAVQQGSPLRDKLNSVILQMLNKRRMEKLMNKWWWNSPSRRECNEEYMINMPGGITMQNVAGIFMIISIGIAIACFILGIEYSWYKYRKTSDIILVREVNPSLPIQHI